MFVERYNTGLPGPYTYEPCCAYQSLDVPYPTGLRSTHVVRLPLDDFNIRNFYLTVRFRPTGALF